MSPDETCLEHERLELAAGRLLAFDAANLAQQALDLLALVTVEVGLHPCAEVAGLPDVEDAVVPADEPVHAGRVRQSVGEPDLAEVGSPSCADDLAEIAERQDAQPAAEIEQPVQDLRARHRVVERSVGRLHACPEVLGQRLQTNVGDVRPHDPPGELGGAHGRPAQEGVIEPGEVLVQEREVEASVVGHEHRVTGELEERRQHRLDRRFASDQEVVDPREVGDERGDRLFGVDQRVERPDALAPRDLDRPDLRDPRVPGRPAGRLEIDDHERDLSQRHALREGGLDRCRLHGRLRSVGPKGRHTVSNRCSRVKDPMVKEGDVHACMLRSGTDSGLSWRGA